MSELHRLVNACLLPGLPAGPVPDWAHQGLRAGLPGFALFPPDPGSGAGAPPRELFRATAAALRATAPDALIAVDEEGGDVTRLEHGTGSSYPGNLALGVADDPAATGLVAAAVAADLRAAGVNLNLAPSVDVNSDPDNPVIGVRSFGADPKLVATHGAAFVRATQGEGVAACAKHFPGHGATSTDSHRGLAVVDCDPETFRSRELAPFRAAVEAGVRSVMAAQVLFPAVDPVHPANTSRILLHEVLREELGFEGVVIGTALAILGPAPAEELTRAAVDSLRAGADLLLLGPADGERVHRDLVAGLAEAVRSGALAPELLAQAAARTAHLRAWATPPDRGAGLTAARRAVRAEGAVALAGPATVVEVGADAGHPLGVATGGGLAEALGRLGRSARTVHASAAAVAGEILALAAGTALVLVVRDARRAPAQRALVGELLAARPDAVLVALGMPEDAELTSGPVIRAYGAGAVNTQAAAELLAGVGGA
ncbi:glycoside hydrolase family 3 protein [Kitasatospora sp. NPDC101801]|uniref:glycoside hydrolase family 3 protein n=1 Tax=Kitasatospora sp. NPDC101801 TaxID=3364103 RepID=UPI003822AEA8